MMRTILFFVLLSACFNLHAQVGFNNPNPDASSLLDLKANDKGLLIPRLSTAQREAISSPATSLLVYDTDKQGFYYYNSGVWYSLNEWVKNANSNDVSLSGNASIAGQLNMNSNKIVGVSPGTASTEAANKQQVDAVDAAKVNRTGDTMTGNLDFGNSGKVTGIADGSSARDGVNKQQLDLKADKQQSGWQNLTLTSPWSNQNRTAQYRIDSFGKIHLRGQVWTSGTTLTSSNLLIASLPAVIRPSQDQEYAVEYFNGSVRRANTVIVNQSGTLTFANGYGATAGSVSLDGISYWLD